MKKIFVISWLLITMINTYAQHLLSPNAQISVFTILPGDELYTKFGHSAIRVRDPERNIDWVFNYGTFDFNTPHFYLKFVRGRLNYMLSVQPFQSFYQEYRYERRSSYEQVLDITQAQKERIFKFLWWNAQPENRYYLYDFLYDNCATRVRDVLVKELGDSLILPRKDLHTTFRREISRYISNPWLMFGINLLIGPTGDRKLDMYTAMFLPDYVDSALAQAYILLPGGQKKPLVRQAHFIYKFSRPQSAATWWYSPLLVFTLLLLVMVAVSLREAKIKKRVAWLDVSIFAVIGLVGVVLLGMWLLTDHQVAQNNWNIAWAFPLHLVYAFLVTKQRLGKFAGLYANFFRYYYLALVVLFPVLPQRLDFATIPLMLILFVRFHQIWKFYKRT